MLRTTSQNILQPRQTKCNGGFFVFFFFVLFFLDFETHQQVQAYSLHKQLYFRKSVLLEHAHLRVCIYVLKLMTGEKLKIMCHDLWMEQGHKQTLNKSI